MALSIHAYNDENNNMVRIKKNWVTVFDNNVEVKIFLTTDEVDIVIEELTKIRNERKIVTLDIPQKMLDAIDNRSVEYININIDGAYYKLSEVE